MYNENGHLVLENGETKDLCDCLEESCSGCHFQCKKCRSPKCGHECRKNRIWTFDTGMIFFVDSVDLSVFYQKLSESILFSLKLSMMEPKE